MTPAKPLLPDARVRAAILNDIDANMVVEAAAGTGKTTCLVGRLMTLFRAGALAGEERLAAVTFTHKAASELRERLERELAAALRDGGVSDEAERRNLEAAALALPDCHIGTIHSFCARLLRERPVEAGVGPDFRELDDEEDELFRRQAWKEFAAELRRGKHPRLYRVFETFGLDQAELEDGFVAFAEYPDVAAWPGTGKRMNDVGVDLFVEGLEKYCSWLPGVREALRAAECGNDEILPVLRILDRRLPRLARPIGLADAFRLSGLFRENLKQVQKHWVPLGFDRKAAKERLEEYNAFYAETVKPFRNDCLAAVYAATMESFAMAQNVYDRLRRENGVLNFQDLLLAAAAMLRDFPGVRADLAERYARLLVDEVQDTDPVQAEIMFLLAAKKRPFGGWRNAEPRPGSLFIVGDPKQSIYRFRRADIVVYQDMKRRIAATGGQTLGLSSNFRGQPAVLDWVNRTFGPSDDMAGLAAEAEAASGRFAATESKYGPAYIPLEPALSTPPDCFSGVFALQTMKADKKAGMYDAEIIRDEAARIAAFIRHAVDSGLPLPERSGGVRPARAGDFLVITYKKASSAVYADALRRLGLDCVVAGGGTLRDSAALALLLAYVRSLAEPDNPILLTAVLRGGLFGVADTDLYRWKRAGGEFSFLRRPADVADSPLPAILDGMARHRHLFRHAEPVRALAEVAGDLGLWARSCLDGDPATAAGALAAAFELLAAESISSVGKLAERLAWHIESHEQDTLPAAQPSADAVRIMNLHKTKGLEAPVVFLACTRGTKTFPAAFAIRRDGELVTGGLSIRAGEYGERVLARPEGWDEMAEEEELFLAAEKTRLNYVAATRAGAALIVSIHHANGLWQSRFLPPAWPGAASLDPLPEPAGPIEPPAAAAKAFDPETPKQMADERAARRGALLTPTYATARAKPEGDWQYGDRAAAGDLSPEQAMNLGEAVHSLLESPHQGEALAEAAERVLRDYDLPLALSRSVAEMVERVWRSPVWQRANAAAETYREAPFTRIRRENGMEVIERGVIDLVFREGDGWVIVDYKSDRLAPDADPAEAARRHAGQLAAYAEAWRGIAGGAVAETGIYFLRIGKYVRVE